jgi:hypothetical protein
MRVYSDNAGLCEATGATPLLVTGDWHVFKDTTGQGTYDRSSVSVEACDNAATTVPDTGGPILIDIECYDLHNDAEHGIREIRTALMRWKTSKRNRLIGLYGTMPERNFWSPVNHVIHSYNGDYGKMLVCQREVEDWSVHNQRIADSFAPLVDFICPSVYALDERYMRFWPCYADANIREAERVANGKPVWPIVQPVYPTGTPIALDQWRKMAEFIQQHDKAAAMCVFCPASYKPANGWMDAVAHAQAP